MIKDPYPKIPCPPITGIVETEHYRIARDFVSGPYWEPEYDRLFAPDVRVEFPHAPPGMLQAMNAFEFGIHRRWHRLNTRDWRATLPPTLIPTTDPDLFIAVRFVAYDIHLGKRDTRFSAEVLSKIVVRDGRISQLCEYEDPIAYYHALGIQLPTYFYRVDTVDEPACFRMGEGQASRFTRERNLARAIASLINPITGDDGDPEPLFSHDVRQVLAFAPYDQPRLNEGSAFDRVFEWMFRVVPEWDALPNPPFHQAVDENVFMVETYGYGRMTWSGFEGHYHQREMMLAFVNAQGKINAIRVYFNPLQKYTSMNISIPTIPYLNY